jgi:hypothetical protein
MNPKTTIGLVLAAVLAMLGVWWAQSTGDDAEAGRSGPQALFESAPGDLTAFEIVDTRSEQPFGFARDGENWRLVSPITGPAEQFAVNGEVNLITGLKYEKQYPPGQMDRPDEDLTSLDKPLRIVRMTGADGRTHVVRIGKRQIMSTRTYVRLNDDETIYLVDEDVNAKLKCNLSDYRAGRVAEFATADAIEVEASGDRQYRLTRSGGSWTIDSPIKARGDTGKINALLSGLANLRVAEFVDDAPASLRPFGLDPPRLVIAVNTEKKNPKPTPPPPASAPAEPEFDIERDTMRIALGGEADGKVFAKIDDAESPAVFQIADSTYTQLATPLDDLRDKKIAGLPPGQVQQITLTTGGQSVKLQHSAGRWQITEGLHGQLPLPAEFAAVDELIRAVRELSAAGFEDAEMPTFGLGAPRATIELTAQGQVDPYRLTIGGLTGSETGAYVRNDREAFVAVASAEAVTPLLASPASFLTRELVTAPQDEIVRFDLSFRDWRCTVSRESGAWRFVSPVDGAADESAVQRLVSDFANLRGRKVVAAGSDASAWGLADPEVRVRVLAQPKAAPKPPTTQPDSAPAEEPPPPAVSYSVSVASKDGRVFAMREGGLAICEIDAKVLDDLKSELFDTDVIDLDPPKASMLAFSGTADFSFTRRDERWKLVGEPTFSVDEAKVNEVLTALNDLRATRFARYAGAEPAEYGLDDPELTISVGLSDSETISLWISARGPNDGDRYACLENDRGRVFVISAESLMKFLKQVAAFQKAN